MPSRRMVGRIVLSALIVAAGVAIATHRAWLPPAYDPTRPLDLGGPRTFMTPVKLRVLSSDQTMCRAALATSALRLRSVPVGGTAACPVTDGTRVDGGPAPSVPAGFLASCRLAVRWSMFQTDVAEPAARAVFGMGLRGIRQAGSFACRDIRDRPGAISSHATADAIDVSAFVLDDGREIPVSAWHAAPHGPDPRIVFLHRVRDGACAIFGVVLSPDYNGLHAGHLHLQATGFGLCD
ncbi:extensin family protein [Gluconacetobacter azotocaptans]|uniref:Extensin family protein n=1 Tax=Gluconacetobacter azotocaptans TaxID=142834 RepID=A0A7W4JQ85_9PROT|nr:extensin family protein [Gluconacetobacter azotocaptans]MBB2188891.1 extensin family protein [Gluconacetobacter azotocaptans]